MRRRQRQIWSVKVNKNDLKQTARFSYPKARVGLQPHTAHVWPPFTQYPICHRIECNEHKTVMKQWECAGVAQKVVGHRQGVLIQEEDAHWWMR
jgi:hypothetical protein